MKRFPLVLMAALLLCGCRKDVISVSSDTRWRGTVNHAEVSGEGSRTYELDANDRSFIFTKETRAGSLSVRFVQGRGDEPGTTAPYGSVWGSAW